MGTFNGHLESNERGRTGNLVAKLARNILLAVLIMCCLQSNAQEDNMLISVAGNQFTYPLVKRWIAEYSKENPRSKIEVLGKANKSKLADISIIAHQPLQTDLDDNKQVVYVNKYALLPVTGSSNKYLKDIKKRGLNKKELEKLFFQENFLDEGTGEKPNRPIANPVNIYSRDGRESSAIAFAGHFGFKPSELKGKKILGDDIYLISSIQKDTTGVTFNNLGYLYDLQTRKLKDGIAVLPLDIDEKAIASINLNVDEALTTIENGKFETIPVEKVGFIFNNGQGKKEVLDFVKWVVNEGQKFNHEYGFLNLDKKLQADQGETLTASEKMLSVK